MGEIKTSKISSKGQITIPKSMRKLAGIKEGDIIAIVSEGKTIVLMNSDEVVKSIKKRK